MSAPRHENHTVTLTHGEHRVRASTILDEKDLSSTLNGQRTQRTHRKVRGYVDGCFDVMHSGHYNLFRMAGLKCDELVVGVHSSSEIEKTKGAKPVQTDEERLRLVAAVKWVDEVVLSTDYSPDYLALLDKYDCDFCMHGSDVNLNSAGQDPFAGAKKAGRFQVIDRVDFISSSTIINRLLKATDPDPHVQKRSEAEEDADSFLLTTDRLCKFMNTTRHRPHVPADGEKVVYVAGSWDLFHSGHVRLLQEAKKLGGFLIVGLHEDTTVQNHCGIGYPIMNLFERAMNVLGCRDVDEVVFDAPYLLTEHMIDFLKIDVVVEPSMNIDYPRDSKNDTFECLRKPTSTAEKLSSLLHKKKTAQLVKVQLPEAEVLQTTTLIKRIESNREIYVERNKKKGGD